MEGTHEPVITKRDRVLRAWENATELVRDYQAYAHELHQDRKLSALFAEYAEDEARHAAALLGILHELTPQ